MKTDYKYLNDRLSNLTESIKDRNNSHLVSFVFTVEETDFYDILSIVNEMKENIFYFSKPADSYSLISSGSALSLSNPDNPGFNLPGKNYFSWKEKFITNINYFDLSLFPLINVAVKFDPDRKSEEWKDFDPVNINIPEFTLLLQKGKAYCLYNFIFNKETDLNSVFNRLVKTLNEIYPANNQPVNSSRAVIKELLCSDQEDLNNWIGLTGKALTMLSENDAEKIVLSRYVTFSLDNYPDWDRIFTTLNSRFNDCYNFLIKKNDSCFFGASPEMFLKINNGKLEAESLAGSAPRGTEILDDNFFSNALMSSNKEQKEHQLVTDFIKNNLSGFTANITLEKEKRLRKLENIQHLVSKIKGDLKNGNDIFNIINALFPTPAVCGVPKEIAFNFIRESESHDRGFYSGLTGWMDFNGNCEISVAIRSALIKDKLVIAYAGAGMVKDSNPEEEFIETKLKLDPVLSLFKPEA